MTLIDPSRTWAKVEERLADETDPVLRRNLATVLEHMKAESVGDVDGSARHVVGRHRAITPTARPSRPSIPSASRRCGSSTTTSSPRGRPVCSSTSIDSWSTATACSPRASCGWPIRAGRCGPAGSKSTIPTRSTCTRRGWPPSGRWTRTARPAGEDTYTGGDGFAGIADRKLAETDIAELAASS